VSWYAAVEASRPRHLGGCALTRAERVALLTSRLLTQPGVRWSLRDLADGSGAARSTISEDLDILRRVLPTCDAGELETTSGPHGGVRFLPRRTGVRLQQTVRQLAETLARPDRVLPGGFLFMTDVLFSPEWSRLIGECFAGAFADTPPDAVVTVETRGISIALMTARALGCPLVLLRRDARVTEGSAVSINYVSGSTQRIQSMSVPRRALTPGTRVLIIDDFMKGGGTARGMVDLLGEVGAEALGIGVVVATTLPAAKKVPDYRALLLLEAAEDGRPLRLRAAPWVQQVDAAAGRRPS
jgi:purine operon repressor